MQNVKCEMSNMKHQMRNFKSEMLIIKCRPSNIESLILKVKSHLPNIKFVYQRIVLKKNSVYRMIFVTIFKIKEKEIKNSIVILNLI